MIQSLQVKIVDMEMTVARMIKEKENLRQVGPLAKSVVSLNRWLPASPVSKCFTPHSSLSLVLNSNLLLSGWCWNNSIAWEWEHGCSSNRRWGFRCRFGLDQPVCSFKAFWSQVLPNWMFRRRLRGRCAVIRLGSSVIRWPACQLETSPSTFPFGTERVPDSFQEAYCKLYENACLLW